MSRHISRRGFTFIEVLVTIGIMGIVIAIAIPAVQSALEAARRMQCKNNLRQIGLALHNYHDKHKSFPSGWIGVTADGKHEVSGTTGWGWAAMLLPELNQDELFEQADFESSVMDLSNEAVRRTHLSIFRCPSDPAPDTWDLRIDRRFAARMFFIDDQLATFATANYVGNFGAGALEECGSMIGLSMQCTGETQGDHSGIFYHNSNVKIAEVLDGTSNTMMVGERQSSADGAPASFATWAGVGAEMGAWGENPYSRVLASANHPINSEEDGHFTNFSSSHPGISQFLFVDGHVRPVNDLISMDAFHAMASTGEQLAQASNGMGLHHTLPDNLATGLNGPGGGIGDSGIDAGFGSFLPVTENEPVGTSDLNDSQPTGQAVPDFGTGPGQQPYAIVTGDLANNTDWDYYNLDLKAGDIIGVNLVTGGLFVGGSGFPGNPPFPFGLVTLVDEFGVEIVASPIDIGQFDLYPDASQLPTGGGANYGYVIPRDGTYSIVVSGGTGSYDLDLWSFRPILETQPPGAHQILFLDFDGAIIDANAIFGVSPTRPGTPGTTSVLTSLFFWTEFVRPWDEPDDFIFILNDLLYDTIMDLVLFSLDTWLRAVGENPRFDIEIRQNLDPGLPNYTESDPFEDGEQNVSRVITGGFQFELGIPTIGIAQSIDPGNFETEETAVVLMDILAVGLNDIPIFIEDFLDANPNATEEEIGAEISIRKTIMVATAIANVIIHEVGHYVGNWHTDGLDFFVGVLDSIMDEGTTLEDLVGAGADGEFFSNDDVFLTFIEDTYSFNEFFFGTEDTLNTTAHGLNTGIGSGPYAPLPPRAGLADGWEDVIP